MFRTRAAVIAGITIGTRCGKHAVNVLAMLEWAAAPLWQRYNGLWPNLLPPASFGGSLRN